jgi:hypothetical protein
MLACEGYGVLLLDRRGEAGGPTVSLWEIPQAGHTGGLSAVPVGYEQRVVECLDRALTPRSRPVR